MRREPARCAGCGRRAGCVAARGEHETARKLFASTHERAREPDGTWRNIAAELDRMQLIALETPDGTVTEALAAEMGKAGSYLIARSLPVIVELILKLREGVDWEVLRELVCRFDDEIAAVEVEGHCPAVKEPLLAHDAEWHGPIV